MKPHFILRLSFIVSLCLFAISCQKDLTMPVTTNTTTLAHDDVSRVISTVNSNNTVLSAAIPQPVPVVLPWTAKIMARRGEALLSASYTAIFNQNPTCQMILFDSEHQQLFGFTKMLSTATRSVNGTPCSTCKILPEDIKNAMPTIQEIEGKLAKEGKRK